MRVFEIPMLAASLLGLGLLPGLGSLPVHADFTFGTPVNLGPVVNSGADVSGVCISHDGLSLYFGSTRPNGYGSYDLWVTTRKTPDSEWGTPVNLGPTVNSPAACMTPSISTDGLTLYFSDLETPTSEGPLVPGGMGSTDIWVITRDQLGGPWSAPTNLGAPINHAGGNICPSISVDGLTLYFCCGASRGGYGFYDIWATTRQSVDAQWDSPVNLGPTVNTAMSDAFPSISSDDLVLFLSSGPSSIDSYDMYMSQRESRAAPWGESIKLPEGANTNWGDLSPSISSDSRTLYFISTRPGGYGGSDIWQISLVPIVDFNGDGKLDLVDLVMLIDDWGTDTTLCDIGPMPWGDGKVDIEDLKVFMTYYEKENATTRL